MSCQIDPRRVVPGQNVGPRASVFIGLEIVFIL